MPLICESCGNETTQGYYVELEHPNGNNGLENTAGRVCGSCAKCIARYPRIMSVIQSNGIELVDERGEHARAADGLCEVSRALENTDYNTLIGEDLGRLLEIKREVTEMCLRYRNDQHAIDER